MISRREVLGGAAALVAVLGLGGCETMEVEEAAPVTDVLDTAPPLIPFQTRFSHWDHHWLLWTPEHPTYESIEVASKSLGPDRDLVGAWFTERAGARRQVHYLNDPAIAAAWPSAHYREIAYRTRGEPGTPLDLDVHFADADGAVVEWTVRMDRPGGFEPTGAGLIDPRGRGTDRFFLVFYREKTRRTVDSRLTIGGRDFSFPRDPAIAGRYAFQAAYSSNVFVTLVPFTPGRVELAPGSITLPSGELLERRPRASGTATTVYASGPGNAVTAELAPGGALWTFTRADEGHVVRFTFDPPLPAVTGGQVRFRIDLDDLDDAIQGLALVTRQDDRLTMEWRPERPEWASAYRFESTVTHIGPTGYDVSVAPATR